MNTLTTREPAGSLEPAGPAVAPREVYRRELAELLDLDPASLPDRARLVEELGLDSLALMRVLVWLERRGVVVGSERDRPARVGDLLALIDAATGGMSIRIGDGRAGPAGVTDVPAPQPPAWDPLVPVLTGNGLRLDPVTPEDTRFLYTLACAPETSFHWRYRGAPPPLERFTNDMWNQIVVQFVARRIEDDQPVGQLIAYGADPTARFLYLGAVFIPSYSGTGLAARAVGVFVRYLFHTFPLAKVYLEVPGYNWPQVRSGEGTLFEVEGVLRDHHYYAGRCWDQYLCAIHRDRLLPASPR
jgi:RimJ/RimL family protein N-acetyltransferase/aryl carrier-like protein